MAWFWRGAQSAFFYYVSCAPCANVAFERRRAKQKARAERETKELMKHASRHTNGQIVLPEEYGRANQERVTGFGAFTTNIYWQEDIELGPHPKKGRHRGGASNIVDTGEKKENTRNQSQANHGAEGATTREIKTTGSTDSTGTSSLDTLRPGTSRDDPIEQFDPLRSIGNSEALSRKRYQRPDELLWGEPVAQRDWEFYARGRNPDINALCPPVVSSKPANSSQALWMLQPPPPAKLMEGKQTPIKQRPNMGGASGMSETDNIGERSSIEGSMSRFGKAHICSLGERMTDLHEPDKYMRKPSYHSDEAFSGVDRNSRAETISGSKRRRNNQGPSINRDTEIRSLSRDRRPRPIKASASKKLGPKVVTDDKHDRGFDPYWTFPHRFSQDPGPKIDTKESPDGLAQVDGYHSEPEPRDTISISFQDFAALHFSGNPTSGISDTHLQITNSNPCSSIPQFDSNLTSFGSPSARSSASSLRPLEELVNLNGYIGNDNSDPSSESSSLSALANNFAAVDGRSKVVEDLEYWSGGREFRLGNTA